MKAKQPAGNTSEWFSAKHASAAVGCGAKTLRAYARDGVINPIIDSSGIHIYSRADIDAARAHYEKHDERRADNARLARERATSARR